MPSALSPKQVKTPGHHYPAVTVDVVVFTLRQGQLQVLLVRRRRPPFAGCWAIPGGFVEDDEPLEAAAQRELFEETGAQGVYLEQLYTFGDPGRDPRGRVITVAYIALAPADKIQLRAGDDAQAAQWFSAYHLPELAFDHSHILAYALRRLRYKLEYTSLAFQLLPRTFTLSELQGAYEIILNTALDKRNFRKKILAAGVLVPTTARRSGNHRPARLYRFQRRPEDLGTP